MANNFYVYHHPSVTGKTFAEAVEEKILIGTRYVGPNRTPSFSWVVNPFEFISKYYGEFWWVIDDNDRATPCYSFALEMAACKVVTYEHQAEPSTPASSPLDAPNPAHAFETRAHFADMRAMEKEHQAEPSNPHKGQPETDEEADIDISAW